MGGGAAERVDGGMNRGKVYELAEETKAFRDNSAQMESLPRGTPVVDVLVTPHPLSTGYLQARFTSEGVKYVAWVPVAERDTWLRLCVPDRDARYPHQCPRCSGPAYVGFVSVDCKLRCKPSR